ncbi:MAG: hypothetical protein HC836_48545 [Richelia sp. RM2_1_2]|nr:hypothetical protein [Richelia sp. RM2_1_2]
MINKFIISPPFGSYISHKNATSVVGTYTYVPRSGKAIQALKTLRYTELGWVNKIGLKNPGIKSIKLWDMSKIYSISGIIDYITWHGMLEYIPSEIMVEMNLSCPNVKDAELVNDWVITRYCKTFPITILKISPLSTISDIKYYYELGAQYFHISNTLPTERGGLSGRELQKYTLPLIEQAKNYFSNIKIIGGGGIYTSDDLRRYSDAGSDYFSLATVWFTPWRALKLLNQQ